MSVPSTSQPPNYSQVLADLKARVGATQLRAAVSVNRELVELYFAIGRELVAQDAIWGTKVIEQLARDLKTEFPEMAGFSRTNLFYMKQVYLAWKDAPPLVQQAVGLMPWGHHLVLLTKLSDPQVRAWYLSEAIQNGWSRGVLTVQIETRFHERSGKALSNFARTLPPETSDLAHQTLKYPYVPSDIYMGAPTTTTSAHLHSSTVTCPNAEKEALSAS